MTERKVQLHIENPKDSTPRLLELIQQFGSVAGYKINAQKSVTFLYNNNKPEEGEIKESIPFTIAPKNIRYLGINLTKEVKELYPKNYRILLKEIEEDTKRWKNIPCSWIGRIYIVKCQCYPGHITCPMQSLLKHHGLSSKKVGINHVKICVESEKTLNSQSNLEKEKQSRGHHNA